MIRTFFEFAENNWYYWLIALLLLCLIVVIREAASFGESWVRAFAGDRVTEEEPSLLTTVGTWLSFIFSGLMLLAAGISLLLRVLAPYW